MKITKGLTWPFLLFTFASLIVFMGALAALQHNCFTPAEQPTTTDAAFDFSSPNYGICRRNFRFHWFSFAFVAATLIGMMIAAAMGQGLHYSRPFWIGMLAVSTMLMMIMCETFTGVLHLNSAFGWYRPVAATLAGAVMTVTGLVLLMMAVGTDWEHRRGYHGNHDKPVSGVTGAAVPVQNVRVVEDRV